MCIYKRRVLLILKILVVLIFFDDIGIQRRRILTVHYLSKDEKHPTSVWEIEVWVTKEIALEFSKILKGLLCSQILRRDQAKLENFHCYHIRSYLLRRWASEAGERTYSYIRFSHIFQGASERSEWTLYY